MKGLTLTNKEQARLQELSGVIEDKVSVSDASGLMGVSERHTWRLLAAYRREGAAAVAHGNRGRKPATTTCSAIQEKVRELARGIYAGLNHTHLTEMLAGREGISLSRSTMRRILLAGVSGVPVAAELPSTAADGSGIPRRGCCYKWMGAATTGCKAEDHT